LLKQAVLLAGIVTITASQQEVQQLAAMLEQYGRACAAFLPIQNCATVPLLWEQKLQAASDEASKPAEPAPDVKK
jgi:hypothetical protein